MINAINAVVSVLLNALGAAAVPDSGTVAGVVTAVAVTLLAAALVAVLLQASGGSLSTYASLMRPRRAIDVSALLAQSDPNASGHPRPRAPGIAAVFLPNTAA